MSRPADLHDVLDDLVRAGRELTWTDLTYVCVEGCERLCRAAQEAIDAERQAGGEVTLDCTDADMVAGFKVCMSCASTGDRGADDPVPGEHLTDRPWREVLDSDLARRLGYEVCETCRYPRGSAQCNCHLVEADEASWEEPYERQRRSQWDG